MPTGQKKITEVEFAIKNSVHSSGKTGPFMLLFGVEQRGRITDELTEYLQYRSIGNVNRNLSSISEEAEKYLQSAQDYNVKFVPSYRGPYFVYKVLRHQGHR